MPLLTNQTSRFLGGARAKWYRAGGAPAPLAVYQPKGAASLAASYVNLVAPGTNNCATGTAPTFATATGWTFTAASSQYLTTGLVPVQATTTIVRFASATAGAAFSTRQTGAYRHEVWPFISGSPSKRQYANGQSLQINDGQTSGVMAVAGLDPYLNGADDGSLVALAGTAPAMLIGASNDNGTPSFFFGGVIIAFAHYGSVLTPAQVAAVSTAMAAL